MVTKTITVTEEAYRALSSLKDPRESFSETLVRVSKRKSLDYFYGVLSKKTGEKLEKAVKESRKERNKVRENRMKRIVRELRE